MNDGNATDVDRALAAIGATPIRYRNFGNHNLRPAAAYLATPASLDDTVYDPFAPQAAVHSTEETQPDVLLPANPPTADVLTDPPPDLNEAAPPRRPAVEQPRRHVLARVASKPEPVRAAIEVPSPRDFPVEKIEFVATPAPSVVPAKPELRVVVTPVIASRFIARAAAAPAAAIAAQSIATSLPSLGTRVAAREAVRVEGFEPDAGPLSIREMFRFLNQRSVAERFSPRGFGSPGKGSLLAGPQPTS